MSLGRIAGLALLLLLLLALGAAWYLMRTPGQVSGITTVTPASPPSTAEQQPSHSVETPSLGSGADASRSQVETAPAPYDPTSTWRGQGSIHGRVIDDLGAAVPKFEIRSMPVFSELRTSDQLEFWHMALAKRFESEDGSFVIDGLAESEWLLTATRNGNVTSSPVRTSVPAVGEALLVVVLPRPSTIDGRVVGSDDSPVSGASIHARVPGKQEPRLHWEGEEPEPLARSDAQGRFHLEDVTPGTFALLAAPADGCDSAWTEVMANPGARTEVVLRLNAGGRIVGVVDPSCGPTADREIHLYGYSGVSGWREARSDASGGFAIEHVVPQRYTVELKSERQPNGDSGPQEKNIRRNITVKPGETTEVRFSVGQEAIHVRGIVRRGGLPLEGLAVTVYPGQSTQSKEQRTKTAADGSFETRVEALGEYHFSISTEQQSYISFLRTLTEPDGTTLFFDLPTGIVSGVVLSPSGERLKYVPVTLLRVPEDPAQPSKDFMARYGRTKTDEKGNFVFEFLQSGSYSLRAPDGFYLDSPPPRVPYGGVVISELTVVDGPGTSLEIRLVAEGKISGQVLDGQGAPVSEAGIQVFDTNDLKRCAYYELRTDVRGWFEIGSIAPGTYTVGAAKSDRRGRSKPVEVVAGKTAEVRVELP